MIHRLNGTAYTVKPISAKVAAEQAEAVLVAAVEAKKILVLSLFVLTADAATEVQFLSDATELAGAYFPNAANGGAVLNHNPFGWFETAAGEALKVTTGEGSATSVLGTYIEV